MTLWDEFVRILNLGRLATNMTLPLVGVSRLNWFYRNRPTLFWSALRQQQTVWRHQTSVVGRFVCLLRQDRPPSLSISSTTSVLFSPFSEGRGEESWRVTLDSTWIDPPPLGSFGRRAKRPLCSGFRNKMQSNQYTGSLPSTAGTFRMPPSYSGPSVKLDNEI